VLHSVAARQHNLQDKAANLNLRSGVQHKPWFLRLFAEFIREMMMKRKNIVGMIALLGCTVTATSALALDAVSVDVPRTAAKSGGFVGTQGSERAGRLSLNIVSRDWSEVFEFGPLLQYRMKRDDDVDNSQVSRMEEVDAATEAGLFAGINTGPWSAQLAFASDVSDEHSGTVVYLKGGYRTDLSDKLQIKFGVSTAWASDDYMETYFGVDATDSARSGLSQYSASSGIKDVGLNVTGNYQFNQKWGLVGAVGYTRMLNDAEDSPVVDDAGDKNQYKAVVAVTYSF
jgi:outer membrane scaffolding protein for murein synthesis (MipA/OmpV family)